MEARKFTIQAGIGIFFPSTNTSRSSCKFPFLSHVKALGPSGRKADPMRGQVELTGCARHAYSTFQLTAVPLFVRVSPSLLRPLSLFRLFTLQGETSAPLVVPQKFFMQCKDMHSLSLTSVNQPCLSSRKVANSQL